MKRLTLVTALAVFFIIVLLPVVWLCVDSLIHDSGFSLVSYKTVLAEKRQWLLFYDSLKLAAGATLLSLLMGVPLAFVLEGLNLGLNRVVRYIYLVPLIIPPHVHAVAWITLLGTNGYVNVWFRHLSGGTDPLVSIYGMKGAAWVMALAFFPVVTALTVSGLRSIDARLTDAARIVSPTFYRLKKITLPLLLPHITAGAVMVFLFSMMNYGVPSLLRVNVFPIEIFAQFSAFYDAKAAVAMSLPLIIVSAILIRLQISYMKERSYITIETGTKTVVLQNPGKWKLPAQGFQILVILMSVLLPVLVLVYEAGSFATYPLAVKTAHKQILTSLQVSLAAATASVTLHFFVAYVFERTPWKNKGFLKPLSFLPFMVLPAILGIGMIQVWNRPTLDLVYTGPAIVVLVFIARFSPFVLQAVSTNLKQIHPDMEEAAVMSNASWTSRLCNILVPLTRPGLTVGWNLMFILSMGELGASLLVMPPGQETLSIRIYTLMHYGAGNLVAGLCLILIGITIIPVSMVLLFNTWDTKTRHQTEDP